MFYFLDRKSQHFGSQTRAGSPAQSPVDGGGDICLYDCSVGEAFNQTVNAHVPIMHKIILYVFVHVYLYRYAVHVYLYRYAVHVYLYRYAVHVYFSFQDYFENGDFEKKKDEQLAEMQNLLTQLEEVWLKGAKSRDCDQVVERLTQAYETIKARVS